MSNKPVVYRCLKEAQSRLEEMYSQGPVYWGDEIWQDIIVAMKAVDTVNNDLDCFFSDDFVEDSGSVLSRFCENCGNHTWGAGPKDDGYVFCEHDKDQHYRHSTCGNWIPEKKPQQPCCNTCEHCPDPYQPELWCSARSCHTSGKNWCELWQERSEPFQEDPDD